MLLELLLEILATVLLALCAVALAILLIPFEISFEGSRTGSSQESRVAIRWLGVTLYRSRPGAWARSERKKKEEEAEEADETGFDPGRLLRILGLIRDSSSSIMLIAKSFRRSVSIRRVSADVTFGLGDPADTAIAFGYIWSVVWVVGLLPKFSLALHPDMDRVRLDGSVAAVLLRVRLFRIVSAFIRAYLHGSFRSLIREARRH